MNKKQQQQFAQLILAALQGDITESQSETLSHLLNADPEALSLYVSLMGIYTELSPMGSVRVGSAESQPNSPVENLNDLIKILAAEEGSAPVVEIPRPTSEADLSETAQPLEKRKINTFNLWTALVSMAALLLMIAGIQIISYFAPAPVATVKDSIYAEYSGEEFSMGSRLTNRKNIYALQKGFAKIEFDSGASVVIEAPAEFQLKSANKMVLNSGRLFAVVPGKAIGFTVDTPESRIVDLGTEFGIDAAAKQGTELHVFSGKTELMSSGSSQSKWLQDVITGQARRVNTVTGRVETIPFKQYHFIRRIDSRANIISNGRDNISLVDLVLGGNGYGTSQETYAHYDLKTGEKTDFRGSEYRKGTRLYQKVTSNPFMDGVFVPDGKNQVVSSKGHVFADCPDTSGLYHSEVCFEKKWDYSASAAWRYKNERKLHFTPSILFMHSNLGLTIDLEAVRGQFPGYQVDRFAVTAGTLVSLGGSPFEGTETMLAENTDFDVWIVVDGQLRSEAQNIRWDGLVNLDVKLTSHDRFLSILVTDGEAVYIEGLNPNHYDLCGLADPRFEVKLPE